MRQKPENVWRKEIRSLIQPTMYQKLDASDSNFFKAGFKTGYRLACLLYTSPSPRDRTRSRMPSSA